MKKINLAALAADELELKETATIKGGSGYHCLGNKCSGMSNEVLFKRMMATMRANNQA